MVECTKKIAKLDLESFVEERNLLSVGYKNVIGACRASWKGDYFRYLAKFKTEQDRKDVADQSLKGYQAASNTASTNLSPTYPIRLVLALNFFIFYYEILNSPER
ncbi:hypothetical protein IFM89_033914 [Coptis chinensis]|uniref:14-3-3 domain-containing protein n=1 Tax=Coptis chinensis TaxID=261450 RepID=A0A835HYY8_9MAGN|nr:hypothetical protein IFM89_033914 [Coptis chinensis]